MADATCPTCGSTVPPKGRNGPRATYCSAACRNRASYLRMKAAGTLSRPARKPPTLQVCELCASPFLAVRSRRFCSKRCNNLWQDANNPDRCSEPDCNRGVRARGLCAMHYHRVARAEGRETPQKWSEKRKINWKKRYALKHGASNAERVDYLAVFERDRWVCGICGDDVNRMLAWPDPMSPSLDHIVPLARGGAHTLENVQLAHLRCNISKGDRIAA